MRSAQTSRRGLVDGLDRYLEAVAAHQPERAALAPSVRFTENGQEIPVGQGLWATATRAPADRHVDVLDTPKGEIATVCAVEECGEPSLLALRLKLEGGLVTEAESLVTRPPSRHRDPVFWEPETYARTASASATAVAQARRTPRERLVEIVEAYQEADAGSPPVPIASRCLRHANGFQTVLNMKLPDEMAIFRLSLAEQLSSGFGAGIRNRDRRYVVDEEYGLVFSFFFFEFEYSIENYSRRSADGWKGQNPRPTTMLVGQVWRIRDGSIDAVDAVFDHGFYGMRSPWSR